MIDQPLIDLQAAHVNQYTTQGVKTDWFVEQNITNDSMHTFSNRLTDNDMFSVMDFARKYELIAFNTGITFQKGKQNEVLVAEIAQLKIAIKDLAGENTRLASILDHHIGAIE